MCSAPRGALACVGRGGDSGGLEGTGWGRLHLSRGPTATLAVVFMVHTLPGIQSKHGPRCRVARQPGEGAGGSPFHLTAARQIIRPLTSVQTFESEPDQDSKTRFVINQLKITKKI